MSFIKSVGLLAVLLCIVLQTYGMIQHSESEKEAITQRLNHQLQLFDRQDVEGWKSDLAVDATVEALGEKWKVEDLRKYFQKMGATHLKSKVTTPFSIADYHAVFARTIKGTTRDGCTFAQTNVVTLVKFNKQLEVVSWQDMWEDIESIKECRKDEL